MVGKCTGSQRVILGARGFSSQMAVLVRSNTKEHFSRCVYSGTAWSMRAEAAGQLKDIPRAAKVYPRLPESAGCIDPFFFHSLSRPLSSFVLF